MADLLQPLEVQRVPVLVLVLIQKPLQQAHLVPKGRQRTTTAGAQLTFWGRHSDFGTPDVGVGAISILLPVALITKVLHCNATGGFELRL